MGLSLFLAKLIGLYLLIVAAIMFLRRKEFEVAIKDIMASEGLLVFTGIINIILGLAIAIGHPIWELSWRGLITLLGYLSLVKGVGRLAFPVEVEDLTKRLLARKSWGYWAIVGVMVLIGAFLTYHGFVSPHI